MDPVAIYNDLRGRCIRLGDRISDRMHQLNRSRRANIIVWALLIAVSFAALYICNHITPYQWDDTIYSNIIAPRTPLTLSRSQPPIGSFSDLLTSQYNHYMHINGRFTAHFFLQLLMWLCSEPVIDALCAIMTIALALVIARIRSFGYADRRLSKTDYLISFALLILTEPEIQYTIFWTTGFFNYVFTILLVIIFFGCLMPLLEDKRAAYGRRDLLLTIPITALGMLAGWTNENIAPTLVCAVAFVIIYRRVVYMRTSPAYAFGGLLGSLAGCCALLLSPGNFQRATDLDEKLDRSAVVTAITRAYYMERAVFEYLFPIIAILIALIIINKLFLRGKLPVQTVGFIIWAVLSVLAMVFSPSYPQRAAFGNVVLLIIPTVSLFSFFRRSSGAGKYAVAFATLMFICAIARLFTFAGYSIMAA